MSEGPYAEYNGARGRLFLIMLPWYQCSDSLLNMLIYVISARQQKYLTILSFNLNLQISFMVQFSFPVREFSQTVFLPTLRYQISCQFDCYT